MRKKIFLVFIILLLICGNVYSLETPTSIYPSGSEIFDIDLYPYLAINWTDNNTQFENGSIVKYLIQYSIDNGTTWTNYSNKVGSPQATSTGFGGKDITCNSFTDNSVLPIDYDGDGDYDLYFNNEGQCPVGVTFAYLLQNNGNSTYWYPPSFTANYSVNSSTTGIPFGHMNEAQDVDGDGDYDFFMSRQLYINNGTEQNPQFYSAWTWSTSDLDDATLGDLNGDGFDDVVGFERSGDYYYLRFWSNNGDNTFTRNDTFFTNALGRTYSRKSSFGTRILLMDMDKDGDYDYSEIHRYQPDVPTTCKYTGTQGEWVCGYENVGTDENPSFIPNNNYTTVNYLDHKSERWHINVKDIDLDGDAFPDYIAGQDYYVLESYELPLFKNSLIDTSLFNIGGQGENKIRIASNYNPVSSFLESGEFFIAQNTNPSANWEYQTPSNLLTTSESNLNFNFNLTDDFFATPNVTCVLNNDGGIEDSASYDADGIYTLTATNVSEGQHNYFINCTDNSGLWDTTSTKLIETDYTVPFVAVLSPKIDDSTIFWKILNITWFTSDLNLDYYIYDIYLTSPFDLKYEEQVSNISVHNLTEVNIMDTTSWSDGIYEIAITVEDEASQQNDKTYQFTRCTPDWQPYSYSECQINDSRIATSYYDDAECGLIFGENGEVYDWYSCDYCTPSIECSQCNGTLTCIAVNDSNNCFAITGLQSDNITDTNPSPYNEECTYQPTYEDEDLITIINDVTGKIFMAVYVLTPIIVIMSLFFTLVWDWYKKRKNKK